MKPQYVTKNGPAPVYKDNGPLFLISFLKACGIFSYLKI